MDRPGTDRRLALVRTIREQNRQDRQLCNSRMRLLYGTEAENTENEEQRVAETGSPGEGRSFRFRLLLAAVLLVAFVVCDRQHLSYHGENTDTIFQKMTQNIEIPGLQGIL